MSACPWCPDFQPALHKGATSPICTDCQRLVSDELDAAEAERALRHTVLDVEKRIEESARLRRVA